MRWSTISLLGALVVAAVDFLRDFFGWD